MSYVRPSFRKMVVGFVGLPLMRSGCARCLSMRPNFNELWGDALRATSRRDRKDSKSTLRMVKFPKDDGSDDVETRIEHTHKSARPSYGSQDAGFGATRKEKKELEDLAKRKKEPHRKKLSTDKQRIKKTWQREVAAEKKIRQERADHIQRNWDPEATQSDLGNEERLNKVLSRCGIAARRKADEMIKEGRVKVNGDTVMDLGRKINPFDDRVQVDGKVVKLMGYTTWVLLNKPLRVLSTAEDDRNRTTALDLVDFVGPKLVPVGRLDRDSTGLLLLTNDYGWVHRLSHPSQQHWKEYMVRVEGTVTEETAEKLRNGILLPGEEDGRPTAPAEVHVVETGRVDRGKHAGELMTSLVVKIREGRNRQIRRMFLAMNHDVVNLHRIGFAGLRVDDLKKGSFRTLSDAEVEKLKKNAKMQSRRNALPAPRKTDFERLVAKHPIDEMPLPDPEPLSLGE